MISLIKKMSEDNLSVIYLTQSINTLISSPSRNDANGMSEDGPSRLAGQVTSFLLARSG
jgi:hypothetical protein